ncbi:MAG: HAMP domain-containing histidine kinase [Kiritimatiellae bacterium]|nr:HAMP domain-containing histidine kinase [Kiritimatiellia bacterium]
MKPKLLIVLILLVAIPLGVLTLGGLRMARHERAGVEQRFHASLQARLGEINASIARLVAQNAQELLRATDVASFDDESLRALRRRSRLVRQFFVLQPDGSVLYPDRNNPELTDRERDFLDRTRALWTNGEKFYHPADVQVDLQINAPVRGKGKGRRIAPSYGWHTWYRDEGVQLIFWQRLSSGHVVGADVVRAAMVADVIASLPASEVPLWAGGGSLRSELTVSYAVPDRLVLSDLDGAPIYEWGVYDPGDGEKPVVWIPVVAPFSSWRLSVYMSPSMMMAGLGRSAVFNVLAALVAVFVALLLLGIYFYRESARDIREATQRVSFVNQVSHELRTPLTNIRLYAEMLDEGLSDANDRVRRQVKVVVGESRRLSRLIGNVLTYARGQRNGLKLHQAEGVLDACVTSTLDTFRPLLGARNIVIEFEPNAPKPCIFDADVVEQIVGNLLSNVEKYAADGKWVRLETGQKGDRVWVAVFDRGPGIARGMRKKVFEPFFRCSSKVNEGASGTGIGLGIARELAQLHGGDVELIPSERGVCFRVTLRASSVPTAS